MSQISGSQMKQPLDLSSQTAPDAPPWCFRGLLGRDYQPAITLIALVFFYCKTQKKQSTGQRRSAVFTSSIVSLQIVCLRNNNASFVRLHWATSHEKSSAGSAGDIGWSSLTHNWKPLFARKTSSLATVTLSQSTRLNEEQHSLNSNETDCETWSQALPPKRKVVMSNLLKHQLG